MTELETDGAKAHAAAVKVSALIFADMEIEVEPYKIRHFIKDRWSRIAPLAHIIHEGPDNTKYPSGWAPPINEVGK
jgi:hypothetical protein